VERIVIRPTLILPLAFKKLVLSIQISCLKVKTLKIFYDAGIIRDNFEKKNVYVSCNKALPIAWRG
jgi:hypothetical protein